MVVWRLNAIAAIVSCKKNEGEHSKHKQDKCAIVTRNNLPTTLSTKQTTYMPRKSVNNETSSFSTSIKSNIGIINQNQVQYSKALIEDLLSKGTLTGETC